MDGLRLHNRSWRDGGGRSCRAETQRVTQPDTPLSMGPSAPAGGAVVPSLGTPQLKSCTTGSCPQSRARLFLRRGGEGPRGRHALPVGKPTSTDLLRRTPNWQCSQTPALRATPHALRPPHICHVISQGKPGTFYFSSRRSITTTLQGTSWDRRQLGAQGNSGRAAAPPRDGLPHPVGRGILPQLREPGDIVARDTIRLLHPSCWY